MLDKDLHPHHIQGLSSADQIHAFFAYLGYNAQSRVEQTPANLGITPDSIARKIKRIELLADQEGLLQVYLFELDSVTVAATRALARAFRNRAGNYLLVLTSDYDHIDFVLLEKYVPVGPAPTAIGQKQIGVRPRPLTVERQKPERMHLRVLRRFTYTETDAIAQHEKLLSAYSVADWSEEHFNNRALFSDYYLMERLREHPVWKEDPKPAYQRFRELYERASARWGGVKEGELRKGLFAPVFEVLGFKWRVGKPPDITSAEPDFLLYAPDNGSDPIAVCLTYPWGRTLDGKDHSQRDVETPDENPGQVVVSLLEQAKSEWVIVTNGKHWRLYCAKAHSKATNYYEVDLEEVLAQLDPADSFRYFWLLFRREAFDLVGATPHPDSAEATRRAEPVSQPDSVGATRRAEPASQPDSVGATRRVARTEIAPEKGTPATTLPKSFLDSLLRGSEDYAKRLGDRLKERVFEEIFPHFAEGFIEYIRKRDGISADLPQSALDHIFQGTLTFLYRLLFLLYAESRDLLPVKEMRGYYEKSLSKLKREVAEAAKTICDEAPEELKRRYRNDSASFTTAFRNFSPLLTEAIQISTFRLITAGCS